MKPFVRAAQPLLLGCAYILTYLAADRAAMAFEIAPGVSLWYPPAGVTLSLLLLFGLRYAPLALAASLISAWFVYPMPEAWATVAMAANSAGGYALVAGVLRRWLGKPPQLEQTAAALGFAFVLLAGGIPIACIGTLVLQAVGLASPANFELTVFRWWLGDTAGIMTLLPVLMINVVPWFRQPRALRRRSRGAWLEIVLQAAALLAALAAVCLWPALRTHALPYLGFVPLTWIVLRHGLPGAGIGIFALNAGTVFVLKFTNANEEILVPFLLFQFATTAMGLGLGAMVSRRDKAEAERNRLLEIVEATPDFIGTATPDGTVLYRNKALRDLRPTHAAETVRLDALCPPWAAGKLAHEGIPVALAQGAWTGESALLDATGREVPVSQVVVPHRAGGPAAVFTVARDISAQKKAEALRLDAERRLLDGQKLESLGVLAGGIAHDFNNLLTTMLGNANLGRMALPADSPVHANLQQIETAAVRAAELCQQMLAYSGRGQLELSVVDLGALVTDTASLLKVSVSKKITLEFDLPAHLPAVRADPTQLRQIVMNLVLNASEAIGHDSGRIHLRAGARRATAGWLAEGEIQPAPPPGDFVFLEVTDTGCGMKPEVRARIFDPFFTTKFGGHGLGLPAVLGIVRGHGGTLHLTSAPGHGTTFRIALPAVPESPRRAESPAMGGPEWRGSGTVLVVDDEETVRIVTARILESCGFTVELAPHGRAAVERFTSAPARYCAVVLDLLMPELDGEQTLAALRRIRPDVPVLFMSGYSGGGAPAASRTASLAKPFPRPALLNALRSLLDAGR